MKLHIDRNDRSLEGDSSGESTLFPKPHVVQYVKTREVDGGEQKWNAKWIKLTEINLNVYDAKKDVKDNKPEKIYRIINMKKLTAKILEIKTRWDATVEIECRSDDDAKNILAYFLHLRSRSRESSFHSVKSVATRRSTSPTAWARRRLRVHITPELESRIKGSPWHKQVTPKQRGEFFRDGSITSSQVSVRSAPVTISRQVRNETGGTQRHGSETGPSCRLPPHPLHTLKRLAVSGIETSAMESGRIADNDSETPTVVDNEPENLTVISEDVVTHRTSNSFSLVSRFKTPSESYISEPKAPAVSLITTSVHSKSKDGETVLMTATENVTYSYASTRLPSLSQQGTAELLVPAPTPTDTFKSEKVSQLRKGSIHSDHGEDNFSRISNRRFASGSESLRKLIESAQGNDFVLDEKNEFFVPLRKVTTDTALTTPEDLNEKDEKKANIMKAELDRQSKGKVDEMKEEEVEELNESLQDILNRRQKRRKSSITLRVRPEAKVLARSPAKRNLIDSERHDTNKNPLFKFARQVQRNLSKKRSKSAAPDRRRSTPIQWREGKLLIKLQRTQSGTDVTRDRPQRQKRGSATELTIARHHSVRSGALGQEKPSNSKQRSQSFKELLFMTNATLQETLENPALRQKFKAFLDSILATESLNFLEAANAYSQIKSLKARKAAALNIIGEFLAEDSPQQVNVSDRLLKQLLVEAMKQNFQTDLFAVIEKEVFGLLEQDSFTKFKARLRFERTASEDEILRSVDTESKKGHKAMLAMRKALRRRQCLQSFAVVPDRDDHLELLELKTEFFGHESVRTRWYKFQRWNCSFYGKDFCLWLIQSNRCKSIEEAVILGQRMTDSGIIQQISGARGDVDEFSDSASLFYFPGTPPKNGVMKVLRRGRSFGDFVLLKGQVKYNQFFAIISIQARRIHFYFNQMDAAELFNVPLSGALAYVSESRSSQAKKSTKDIAIPFSPFSKSKPVFTGRRRSAMFLSGRKNEKRSAEEYSLTRFLQDLSRSPSPMIPTKPMPTPESRLFSPQRRIQSISRANLKGSRTPEGKSSCSRNAVLNFSGISKNLFIPSPESSVSREEKTVRPRSSSITEASLKNLRYSESHHLNPLTEHGTRKRTAKTASGEWLDISYLTVKASRRTMVFRFDSKNALIKMIDAMKISGVQFRSKS